jgi:hypothetical protein
MHCAEAALVLPVLHETLLPALVAAAFSIAEAASLIAANGLHAVSDNVKRAATNPLNDKPNNFILFPLFYICNFAVARLLSIEEMSVQGVSCLTGLPF